MNGHFTERICEAPVEIPTREHRLRGSWSDAGGEEQAIVVVANTIEGGRSCLKNRHLSRAFLEGGLSTLHLDLLDHQEARDRNNLFNIGLLAARFDAATRWLRQQPDHRGVPIGYFASSTGAAAAMVAAARHSREVGAVVVRGGRLDLAWDYLPEVAAPTLLIVSGHDEIVLDLNEWALDRLRCAKELVIAAEAPHLFPDPAAKETLARLAVAWFQRHLHAAPGETLVAVDVGAGVGDRCLPSDMELQP